MASNTHSNDGSDDQELLGATGGDGPGTTEKDPAHWVTGEERTALQVLISGRFRVEFPGRSVVLAEQGDYVVGGRGVDHSWYAEEESVVLTVRWPSVPGYAVVERDDSGAAPPSAD